MASGEELIDLGALLRLVELDQRGSQALLLGLADADQLAVQVEQLLHARAQHVIVDGLDHGLVDSLTALRIERADGTPVTASQRIAQGAAGRFETLNSRTHGISPRTADGISG